MTTRTGVYTFDHLPPGEYYVIAIDAADADGWKDPKTLEALASQATRLTVAAGDTPKTLDLTREGDPMISRRHVVVAIAIACGAAAAAQQPARDNARVAAGTASISGTVFVDGRGEAAGAPRARDAHERRAHLAGSDDDHRRQRRVRLSRSAGGPVRAAGVQERLSQGQLRRVAARIARARPSS